MKRNALVLVVLIGAITAMLIAGKHMTKTGGAAVAGNGRGQAAPDFELKDIAGKTVRLSDLRGKAVLLNFWATWCPPCKIEIPWFVELQKKYAAQGLQVIGVAMDEGAEGEVAKFARESGINYPILIGTDKVGDSYGGVQALPTTFYIGRDGNIVRSVTGLASHSEVEENIRAALAQGNAVAERTANPKAKGSGQ